MKPIEPRVDPEPIAERALAMGFDTDTIEHIQAFLVWHHQKLMARRQRDHRCVECGRPRLAQSKGGALRCHRCQAYRRERLRKMPVSVYMES